MMTGGTILRRSSYGLLVAFGLCSQLKAAPIVTVPFAGTNAGQNNYPAAENPTNIRDATASTKYLNFAKLNTGIIETFPTAVTVGGLTFATANDSPARDPLTFSLYGSNTRIVTGNEAPGTNFDLGAEFTLLASNVPIAGFQTDPTRLTTVPNQAVANATAFRSYAIIFPTVRDAASANSMQIGDVTFTDATGTALAGQSTNPVIGIPEPASAGLLGLAGLGLLARRRRTA